MGATPSPSTLPGRVEWELMYRVFGGGCHKWPLESGICKGTGPIRQETVKAGIDSLSCADSI